MIRRFASLAIKLKVLELDQVVSLGALLPREIVHPCLQWHLKNGNGTRQLENIVHLLLSIARYHAKAPIECIDALADYARKLRKKRKRGLAEKNEEQLKQFDEPQNVRKILLLPFRIIEGVPKKISPHRRAKYYERALSIGIFVYTGLRIQNVRTIHLKRNIRRSGDKVMLAPLTWPNDLGAGEL